jgi:hypothetical protein
MRLSVTPLENGITKISLSGRLDVQNAIEIDDEFTKIAKHVWWRRTDRLTSVPSTPNARLQFRACGGARTRLWASDQELNGGNPRSPIYRAP